MHIPNQLKNGVWHTTSVERYKSILKTGFILPEPDIPEEGRWGGGLDENKHPFVRSIGGVSLFDFRNLNQKNNENKCLSTGWHSFVPVQRAWKQAIWININELVLGEEYYCPDALLHKSRVEGNIRKFIVGVEAAHIGELPVSKFKKVLIYTKSRNSFEESFVHKRFC